MTTNGQGGSATALPTNATPTTESPSETPADGDGPADDCPADDPALADYKALIRRDARANRSRARDRAPADAAQRASRLLMDRIPIPTNAVIAGYIPVREEFDVLPAMDALLAQGNGGAMPVVTGPAQPLLFRRWDRSTDMTVGAYGIAVPADASPDCQPDVLLVPLLAFDRAGRRIGSGAGYYDRTLAALRARRPVLAVGVAFAAQEAGSLPFGRHDQRLDWVVTEAEAIEVVEDLT